MRSLNAKNIVANLHEGEQVNLGWNNSFLSFSEVELRISKSLQSFTALFLSDVASTLQVVESENVLQLLISVDDGTGSVFFTDFDLINQELLNVVGLLVSQKSRQILHKDKGC